jgi:hypothetical protein
MLEVLINDKWVEDIRGSISLEALVEYLSLGYDFRGRIASGGARQAYLVSH